MSVDLDDAMDLLTPEERAAIEDTEESAEELAAKQPVSDENDSDDAEEESGGDEEPVDPPADKPVEAAKDGGTDQVKEEAAAEKVEERQASSQTAAFVPRYQADLPADFQASVQSLNDERINLTRKFAEGSVDQDEYDRQFLEINDRRDALLIARAKAEISSEMQAQTSAQQWQNEVNSFLDKAAANDGIDYRADQEKQNDLDMFVRRLGENPANNDRPMAWFLQEAHRRVTALHGIEIQKQESAPAKAAPKVESRKIPASSIPKTLAQVPGGDGPGDVADEFTDIDALYGDDFEAALARMSPKQREKFAQAGR